MEKDWTINLFIGRRPLEWTELPPSAALDLQRRFLPSRKENLGNRKALLQSLSPAIRRLFGRMRCKLTEKFGFVRFSKGPRMTVVSKNLPSMPPREMYLE